MHIGIDARMFGTAHGGIGKYVEELVTGLAATDHEHTYTIFTSPNANIPPLPDSFTVVRTNIHWYTLAEQTKLPRLFAAHPVDLMHFPHWNIPLSYNKPFVVTIHDLILLHHPSRKASTLGPITYAFKQAAYVHVLRHAAAASRHIITVSEFSKHDVMHTLNVQAEKISVTYLGVRTRETPPTTTHRPYFLYVGVQYPHKNLEFLCNAFYAFNSRHEFAFDLVLCGPRGPFTEPLADHLNTMNKKSARPTISLITNAPDQQIAQYYKGATAFLFPSFYEGFGLPPLEAMSYGTPVVASNATAMPEILGDGAMLISPTNEHEWIRAFEQISSDLALRNDLILRGHSQAQKYDWKKTISSTREVYAKFC